MSLNADFKEKIHNSGVGMKKLNLDERPTCELELGGVTPSDVPDVLVVNLRLLCSRLKI